MSEKFDKSEKDELDYFLRLANDCCNEALRELTKPMGFIKAIDSLYMDFIPHAGSIKPATASILLMNSHASLRAAISLALSGQLLPVFMTLRGSIESALYANAMVSKPELQEVWLKRDIDEKSRQLCRDEFSIGKMFRYLSKTQNQEFSDGIRNTYDSTIDFGAHPNNRSLIRSIRIEELNTGEHELNFAYIHGLNSFELRQSLVACAEIGLAVFLVALICAERHPHLKELNQRALDLQTEVPQFVKQLGLSHDDLSD